MYLYRKYILNLQKQTTRTFKTYTKKNKQRMKITLSSLVYGDD